MPDGATLTRLVLVRHGQAQSFVDQVVGGFKGCSGLSDVGRKQADALRERLERTGELAGAVALYASVLPRAIETAEIISPALGGLEVQQDCDLCEIHTGDEVDGMTWDDFRASYRGESVDRFDPYEAFAPGAESWAEFYLRAGRRLHQLVDDHPGETVVVACHGGIIRAAMVVFTNLPLHHRLGLEPQNTSLTEWHHRGDQPWFEWHLARYNDAAHLS